MSTRISLEQIFPATVALRKVDETSEKFIELVQSIKQDDVLMPILVSPRDDGNYTLVDGLHRFTAAKAAGKIDIPVNIVTGTNRDMLRRQVIANLHRVETKPVEYTRQLKRMMNEDPTLTIAEISKELAVSTSFVSQRLNLLKIKNETINSLVNEGKISVANAVALSSLDDGDQIEFSDKAQTMTAAEFVPTVNNHVQAVRKAKLAGKVPSQTVWQAVSHLHSMKTILSAVDDNKTIAAIVTSNNVRSIEEAVKYALLWALNIDKIGTDIQAEAEASRQKASAQAKADKAAAAAVKKAEAEAEAEATAHKAEALFKL